MHVSKDNRTCIPFVPDIHMFSKHTHALFILQLWCFPGSPSGSHPGALLPKTLLSSKFSRPICGCWVPRQAFDWVSTLGALLGGLVSAVFACYVRLSSQQRTHPDP
ncbi:hypothetical protein BV898_11403 [Hypsibius exemplaris]|uniref:Uncharacterized protein n=1 Tax=Hypsibius exemplaris TaxID=2072580 RepID=A0A1W0WGU3_HYPEX|nr:hypothetical protein BV898_11403 [Hypsibius exemplaris]